MTARTPAELAAAIKESLPPEHRALGLHADLAELVALAEQAETLREALRRLEDEFGPRIIRAAFTATEGQAS